MDAKNPLENPWKIFRKLKFFLRKKIEHLFRYTMFLSDIPFKKFSQKSHLFSSLKYTLKKFVIFYRKSLRRPHFFAWNYNIYSIIHDIWLAILEQKVIEISTQILKISCYSDCYLLWVLNIEFEIMLWLKKKINGPLIAVFCPKIQNPSEILDTEFSTIPLKKSVTKNDIIPIIDLENVENVFKIF